MGYTFRFFWREVWMPWKASSVMEERLRFVARLLDGEAMTEVCREFGISRKTGYKIFDRYSEHGLEALSDRSRRPVRYANQLPAQIETLIVRLKAEKPHWGARKIRELLVRRLNGDVRVPAKSTIRAVPAQRPVQSLKALGSGGSGSAPPSSASSRVIRNSTAATSACTSPSRTKQPGRPASTACGSRSASMPSFKSSMLSDRTRRSA
jgi:transposase